MYKYLIALCLGVLNVVLMPTIALANTALNDTVEDSKIRSLHEVVISAPKVIKKVDKDIYLPTSDMRKLSANGLQLINNLNVPTLIVNDVLGSVTSLGNSVQVRVNGRIVSVNELKEIAPENVKRVEWISHPGLKYDGASAVINLITKNPTAGGSLIAQGLQSATSAWGQYLGSIKINNGRSQWSVGIQDKLTNKIESYRDYSETFTYSDGSKLTRKEFPLGGALTENNTEFKASYNYTKTDTTGHKLFLRCMIFGEEMLNLYHEYIRRFLDVPASRA